MLNLCYWCLFKMHTEKAKLISCFVNDYCIPTTLFKTISNLKIKTIFLFFTQTGLCKLWSCFFQIALFKRKKGTVRSPVLYCRLSLCLSGVVNFALERKLRTYTLRIFHSILIRTYEHKPTYVDSHLPKRVITK